MNSDIDYLRSARYLAIKFGYSSAGWILRHDPEEIYAAALSVIGELSIKYIPHLIPWDAYVSKYGPLALIDELRRSGYMYRVDKNEGHKRPKTFYVDLYEEYKLANKIAYHENGYDTVDIIDFLKWSSSELSYIERFVLNEYYIAERLLKDVQEELKLDYTSIWEARVVVLAKIRIKIASDVRENSPFEINEHMLIKAQNTIDRFISKREKIIHGNDAILSAVRSEFIMYVRANPGCSIAQTAASIQHHYSNNYRAAGGLMRLVNQNVVPIECKRTGPQGSGRLYPTSGMAYGPHILGGPLDWRVKRKKGVWKPSKAAKETITKFVQYVTDNPGVTASQAAVAISHHYSTDRSAYNSLSRLVTDGHVPVKWGEERRNRKLFPVVSERSFGLGSILSITLFLQAIRRISSHSANFNLAT